MLSLRPRVMLYMKVGIYSLSEKEICVILSIYPNKSKDTFKYINNSNQSVSIFCSINYNYSKNPITCAPSMEYEIVSVLLQYQKL